MIFHAVGSTFAILQRFPPDGLVHLLGERELSFLDYLPLLPVQALVGRGRGCDPRAILEKGVSIIPERERGFVDHRASDFGRLSLTHSV